MTVAIVDSTFIMHLFRRYQPAITWFDSNQRFSITSISWMEVMVGVPNKRAQSESLDLLGGFEILFVTDADQRWAMEQIKRLRFSNSNSTMLNDALIAAVAYRLQVPLYTHNLKDMTPMIGTLAVKPYA